MCVMIPENVFAEGLRLQHCVFGAGPALATGLQALLEDDLSHIVWVIARARSTAL